MQLNSIIFIFYIYIFSVKSIITFHIHTKVDVFLPFFYLIILINVFP